MRRPQFQPKLFIGIGETMAYYTLRETYLHEVCIPGEGPMGNAVVNGVYQGEKIEEVRSFHHFNLSQDPDEAIAKAKEASFKLGIPFSCTKEKIVEEMREIKRRTEEQIKADQLKWEITQAQIEALKIKWAMEREAEKIEKFEEVTPHGTHYITWGSHAFCHANKLPREYCTWVVANKDKFEDYSFMLHLAKTLEEKYPEQLLEEIKLKPKTYFGEVGTRYDLELTVIKCFGFEGFYGKTYVTTMADKKGICFNVMSGAFSAQAGDKIKIKATVKEHKPYKGQAQTVLQRVKVLETV